MLTPGTSVFQITLPEELRGSVILREQLLQFSNDGDLPQFKVINKKMLSEQSNSKVYVVFEFKRIFSYHITNTFMPTCTLLVIAQTTLHFNDSKIELGIGLLLTVLLVMYTLYQSITGSLLQTAYLKMIDYWLLFCLFIPFLSFMIEIHWLLQKAKRNNLNDTSKGWLMDEKELDQKLKKDKRRFKLLVHGLTIIFFVVFFAIASMMYTDII